MPFQPGNILLGKYRIEALIGQGAFAEVYRATHLALDTPRALKVLRRNAPGLGTTDYDNLRLRFSWKPNWGTGWIIPTSSGYMTSSKTATCPCW